MLNQFEGKNVTIVGKYVKYENGILTLKVDDGI